METRDLDGLFWKIIREEPTSLHVAGYPGLDEQILRALATPAWWRGGHGSKSERQRAKTVNFGYLPVGQRYETV